MVAYPESVPDADFTVRAQFMEFGPSVSGDVLLRALWTVTPASAKPAKPERRPDCRNSKAARQAPRSYFYSFHSRAFIASTTCCGATCARYRLVVASELWPSCAWITFIGTPSRASSAA